MTDLINRFRWWLARFVAPGGQVCDGDPWECCMHCRENDPASWATSGDAGASSPTADESGKPRFRIFRRSQR